ncbi:MAG: DNA polymerase/3'-5' exonuclease PolX [Candidatus Nealsonbacteria bacterium]|nr:DNA polymerase/3'-5' exonuclease PolX [Candidatus Nealsonbacteria bacterium]
MVNQELAKIFQRISLYLAMREVPFKPHAYERVAFALESLAEDVGAIYKRDGRKGLAEIPGVGESIAEKIEEYLKTGNIRLYEQEVKRMPVDVEELTSLEGVGPKMVADLYRKLKIRNLKELERAARAKRIRKLPRFGEKTERNILEAIEFAKRREGRKLLGDIYPFVRDYELLLKESGLIQQVSPAGSFRRMRETVGDIDLLVTSRDPKKVIAYALSHIPYEKLWGKGETKISLRSTHGFDIDIRVVPRKSYGSALQYFTGSKEHNIATRRIAIEKGLKLSEYGLFKGKKMIAGQTEEEIYNAMGLAWISPEMRENQGEIKLADTRCPQKLPHIIGYQDIKGDLHCHSDWDGGDHSIEEMAAAAMRMGYEYIGIADHTKALHIEHGLDEKQLEQRNKEIDNLNSKFEARNSKQIQNPKFKILKGVEANILKDGSIDIKDEVLAQMDFVIAGIHSNMKMDRQKMTERMIKAMRNPNVDIISHPTGRILKKRDEYQIDFEAFLKAAKETGTILEISAWPERLDLNDQNIRRSKEAGVKMIINTDSHNKNQLHLMEFGIAQARRGWAEKEDIINCWPLEKLLKYFK